MTMTNVYGTLARLRKAAGITDANNTAHDDELELAGDSAARMIDKHCGRPHGFWQDSTVQTRTYRADDPYELFIRDDISTATGLIVNIDEDDDGTYETTLTITTEYVLEPFNAIADGRAYETIRLVDGSVWPCLASGRAGVQVTAKFGWAAVPDDVEKAWLIQAVQLYKSDAAVFGGVQVGLDGGVLRLGPRLHPIAEGLLEGFSKPRVG
jgi:hypothetical protein